MTTWKNPRDQPPKLHEEYWVTQSDLKPFKAIKVIHGWYHKNDVITDITLYAEIKPPPLPSQTPELDPASEAMRLLGLLATEHKEDDAHKSITDFLSDFAANIRADEHDRMHDHYINFDITAAEQAQHERTIAQAVENFAQNLQIKGNDILVAIDTCNQIEQNLKNMEKP